MNLSVKKALIKTIPRTAYAAYRANPKRINTKGSPNRDRISHLKLLSSFSAVKTDKQLSLSTLGKLYFVVSGWEYRQCASRGAAQQHTLYLHLRCHNHSSCSHVPSKYVRKTNPQKHRRDSFESDPRTQNLRKRWEGVTCA